MSSNIDSIFRTRSLGVAATGVPDQYADGRAAKVWELYMGGKSNRTDAYKDWFVDLLRKWNVHSVLDVACGTGIDSVMLLENGFNVVSVDASDKMLKQAFEERWQRRKEPAFDQWIIKEANWLTLQQDLAAEEDVPSAGYEAVICCGNSFAHLQDFEGSQQNHKTAIQNFYNVLKPGGILFIDHRNYDYILDTGGVPHGPNVYYRGEFIKDIKCSNLYVNGEPTMVTLDYEMDIHSVDAKKLAKLKIDPDERVSWKFRLSYYPHRLAAFTSLLMGVFGSTAQHQVYADFKPLQEAGDVPAYYMHVIQKPLDA